MRFSPLTVSLWLGLLWLHVSNADETRLSSTTRSTPTLCPAVTRCLARLDAGKKCAPIPVPERARFQLRQTFVIEKLRPGVWAFLDLIYMSLIISRGSKLVLVDFPEASNERGLPFLTDAVLEILDGRKPKEIEMIYSHAHFDHIGGATRFFEWAKNRYPDATFRIWGTEETSRLIRKSRTKRAILPNIIIRRGAVLNIGPELKVKMTVVGGHTAQDVLLYIPRNGDKAGVVMLVDIIFPRWAPFFNLALTEDLTRFLEVQRLLLKLRFDFFIGGHLQVGSKSDVRDSLEFGMDIVKITDEVFEVSNEELAETRFGELFDPTSRVSGNIWFAFQEFNNVRVDKCVRTMIEKWGCRFGGVDVTVRSHCFIAAEHRGLEV